MVTKTRRSVPSAPCPCGKERSRHTYSLCASKASLRRTGVHSTCGPICPYGGRDCVKSHRSSYAGLYPQTVQVRNATLQVFSVQITFDFELGQLSTPWQNCWGWIPSGRPASDRRGSNFRTKMDQLERVSRIFACTSRP